MKKLLPLLGILSVHGSVLAAEVPAKPSIGEDFALPEKIRQAQRLDELKKQLDEQEVIIRPKQQDNQLQLKHLIVKESPCVQIKQIQLDLTASPESKQDQQQFEFILNKLTQPKKHSIVGQCIGTQSLQNILRYAQNELIKAGYITTQITAAPQDLNQGTLLLKIYPGRLAHITEPSQILSSRQLYTAFPIHSGDILNIKALDQGLENLRRVSNLVIDMQIVPAEENAQQQAGYSDLKINVQPYRKWGASLNVDNSGSKSTGEYIGALGLSLNNPLKLNDSLNLNLSHSLDDWEKDRNQSYYISYQMPFGYYDFGLSYNWYRYDQYVAGFNAPIHYQGESEQTNLNLSRVISRDGQHKTSLYAKAYHKQNKNFIEDIEIEVQRRITTGWNLGIQHRQYLGNAVLDVSLDYRRGTGALNAQPAPEEQIKDANQNPLPSEGYARAPIWSADFRYTQPFSILEQPVQYRLSWRGQYAPKILVPQDRFYIGGRYSVRGFDGELMLSGDNGHYLQQELSFNSPLPNTQFYTAIDQGWVNGRNSIPGKRYLMGSVFGARYYYQRFYLDAFAGHGLVAPQHIKKEWIGGFSLNYSY